MRVSFLDSLLYMHTSKQLNITRLLKRKFKTKFEFFQLFCHLSGHICMLTYQQYFVLDAINGFTTSVGNIQHVIL